MPTDEVAEIVGELPDVRIQDVVDREGLVTDGRVGDASLANLDRRKQPVVLALRCGEWQPEIAEAVVAREEPVGKAA